MVLSDDPETPAFALTMKGKLLVDVRATPSSLMLRDLEPGTPGRLEFEVALRDEAGLAIESVTVDDAETFTLKRLSGAGDNPARYELRVRAIQTPGTKRSLVRVNTTSVPMPEHTIPVSVTVPADLRYGKHVAFMGRNGKIQKRTVRVTARRGDAPTITRVEDPDGLLEFTIEPIKGAVASFDARVLTDKYEALSEQDRLAHHPLYVHTDHRREKRLELTYTIRQRAQARSRPTSTRTPRGSQWPTP